MGSIMDCVSDPNVFALVGPTSSLGTVPRHCTASILIDFEIDCTAAVAFQGRWGWALRQRTSAALLPAAPSAMAANRRRKVNFTAEQVRVLDRFKDRYFFIRGEKRNQARYNELWDDVMSALDVDVGLTNLDRHGAANVLPIRSVSDLFWIIFSSYQVGCRESQIGSETWLARDTTRATSHLDLGQRQT